MDPVTGIGLVAAVAQLITFSVDIVKTIREVYEQGSVGRYNNLEYTSGHLSSLTKTLQQSLPDISPHSPTLTSTERDLIDISRKCDQCAQELQRELYKLHSHPHTSFLAATRRATRAVWKRPKIEEISKQLDNYRSALETSLLFRLSHQFEAQNLQNSTSFASLDGRLQHVVKCLADSDTSLSTLTVTQAEQTRSHTTALIQRLEQIHINDRRFDEVVRSLFYPDIFSRQEQVDHNYDGIEDSFEWIFHEHQPREENDIRSEYRWDDFPTWLKSEHSLYWINGKAGSGKSTLMNYICQHHLPPQLLSEWCLDRRLLTLTYFFWAAGTGLQKSIDGLLRSLIYQMLTKCRELVGCMGDGPLHAWTERRLLNTLLGLLQQTHIPIRVTLFLDGLDEIDGQHRNIVRMIKNLAGLNNVKTCLSSRPLQVFEEAFRGEPGLRLQDLTSPGIRAYADIQLSDLVQRRILHNMRDEDRVDQLVYTIVSRADGVFLWAVMVVRDVRDGLEDMVNLDELTQAIENLPSELESLFMQILRRIKPAYQRDAARFLQIALHATFDSRDYYWPLYRLNLCSLHLINSQHEVADAPFLYERVSQARMIDACKTAQTQLLSHTAGLLELNPSTETYHLLPSQEPLLMLDVNFLHRSAREFLLQNEEARLFLARQGFAKGQVHVAIARGILALIVQFPEREGPHDSSVFFGLALQHIAIAERMLGAAQSHLMRSLVDNFQGQLFMVCNDTFPDLAYVTKLNKREDKYSLDVVGMAAAEDLTLFICEHLGILKLPGDHITKLPNRSSYSPIYVILKWLRPIQRRDAEKDQTMQKLSSNYRQALAGSLRMDVHVDHQLDARICSPVADLGTQKRLIRDEQALAETHLLRCCNPISSDLIRSLLHAGANPMAEMDPEYPSGYSITANFWESWLLFLQRTHSDYLKTRMGSPNERETRPNSTLEVTFEVTKALIAHGADLNMQLRGSRSTSYRCYLKRRELRDCLFDLLVDATAMFVLAECFSKEPEFLQFATEMKSVVFTPVRRLLFIQPLYVSPARGGSCLPRAWLPPVTVDSEDCELLWPLIEEWEKSGRESDLMALESEVGKIWRAQQICTSAEDETLSLADFVMKMADKQRSENEKRYKESRRKKYNNRNY
ncbi:MAG: hypothetical protein Q9185_003981 [Variospora sp. 1 TL-2023]